MLTRTGTPPLPQSRDCDFNLSSARPRGKRVFHDRTFEKKKEKKKRKISEKKVEKRVKRRKDARKVLREALTSLWLHDSFTPSGEWQAARQKERETKRGFKVELAESHENTMPASYW